ncbi:MAG: tetraacyldisaccharide 4'-kinase [Flavobacteriales bacterium]|nr:tetraacyldisaccharide 4'-kinase [Flavobacteriales bacterium]
MSAPAKLAMLLRRLWTWPATVVLGAVLHVRHALYDRGLLKRVRPSVPTIAIGNLALGGTGKTPMLELVVRILADVRPLATLSRGYGRRTSGIMEVRPSDSAERTGDEPLQVKHHFADVRVFVGADRVEAIAHIVRAVPGVRAVVLDDALQHRHLDPGLSILLTTWQRPFDSDALFPAGKLRDLRSRAHKADVVVVTKCPDEPGGIVAAEQRRRLRLKEGQALFFAGITYARPHWSDGRSGEVPTGASVRALLFTGIADPGPLLTHVRSLWGRVDHRSFPDHHPYSTADKRALAGHFSTFAPGPKVLITTEKDAARLGPLPAGDPLYGLPIAVIGMQAFIHHEPERFAALIRDHVAPHPAHR